MHFFMKFCTPNMLHASDELRVGLMPVKVQITPNSVVSFKCNYEFQGDRLKIVFNLSSYEGNPITAKGLDLDLMHWTEYGGYRIWNVSIGETPCYVECFVFDNRGKELAMIMTSVIPGLAD